MGSASFVCQYMERKVNGWVKLGARTQPHAGLPQSRITFCKSQTGQHFCLLHEPLETAIQSLFIPALTG